MNELKITPPEGYEIDKENSTFECIKFKPKELTYDDIRDKICYSDRRNSGWPEDSEIIRTIAFRVDPTICPTLKQMKRIQAINQLMNVAYYFNEIVDKDVKFTCKFIPEININSKIIAGYYVPERENGIVYFKTEESLKKAIKILGEETVKLAISL